MPKLYFYDPGLAAYLLEIRNTTQLATHYAKGALFESFIVSEMIKRRFNQGQPANCFFWRDKNGNEIDCLLDQGESLLPIEIKAGRTVTSNYFKGIDYYSKMAGTFAAKPWIIYGGTINQHRTKADVLSWNNLDQLKV